MVDLREEEIGLCLGCGSPLHAGHTSTCLFNYQGDDPEKKKQVTEFGNFVNSPEFRKLIDNITKQYLIDKYEGLFDTEKLQFRLQVDPEKFREILAKILPDVIQYEFNYTWLDDSIRTYIFELNPSVQLATQHSGYLGEPVINGLPYKHSGEFEKRGILDQGIREKIVKV